MNNSFKIGGISFRLLRNRLKIKYSMFDYELWEEEGVFQGIYVVRNNMKFGIRIFANNEAQYNNTTYLVNEASKAIEAKYPEALI